METRAQMKATSKGLHIGSQGTRESIAGQLDSAKAVGPVSNRDGLSE